MSVKLYPKKDVREVFFRQCFTRAKKTDAKKARRKKLDKTPMTDKENTGRSTM